MFEGKLFEWLSEANTRDELATIVAYILAPVIVMGLAGATVYSPGSSLDLAQPVGIAELKTEMNVNGEYSTKSGLLLILEPLDIEYQIELKTPSTMWLSIDEPALDANLDRLRFGRFGFSGRSPLVGVSDPVAVVLGGEVGTNISIPGGSIPLEEWAISSRRSMSVLSGALSISVFAFGMAVAICLPSLGRPNQDAACKDTA